MVWEEDDKPMMLTFKKGTDCLAMKLRNYLDGMQLYLYDFWIRVGFYRGEFS